MACKSWWLGGEQEATGEVELEGVLCVVHVEQSLGEPPDPHTFTDCAVHLPGEQHGGRFGWSYLLLKRFPAYTGLHDAPSKRKEAPHGRAKGNAGSCSGG